MWVFYLCLDNVELAFITYQFRFDNFFLKILKDARYFNLNPCPHPNLSIFKLLWLETLQPSQLHQVASPSIWRSAAALPQVVARTAVCLRLLPPAHHTCVGGSLLGRREPSHPPASCLPAHFSASNGLPATEQQTGEILVKVTRWNLNPNLQM